MQYFSASVLVTDQLFSDLCGVPYMPYRKLRALSNTVTPGSKIEGAITRDPVNEIQRELYR
jgi:hypothetical protein